MMNFTAYIKLQQLPQFKHTKDGLERKVPRFDVTAVAGYYKPLEALQNNQGQIVFYLQQTRGIINSPDTRRAAVFLMGKNSFNFSSLFTMDYTTPSGNIVAYGNPPSGYTYGAKGHYNPFYTVRNDGFLFLISPDWQTIETLVVPYGVNTITSNAVALAGGVYNEQLDTMRSAAQPIYNY